jgi:hypothetical protein
MKVCKLYSKACTHFCTNGTAVDLHQEVRHAICLFIYLKYADFFWLKIHSLGSSRHIHLLLWKFWNCCTANDKLPRWLVFLFFKFVECHKCHFCTQKHLYVYIRCWYQSRYVLLLNDRNCRTCSVSVWCQHTMICFRIYIWMFTLLL